MTLTLEELNRRVAEAGEHGNLYLSSLTSITDGQYNSDRFAEFFGI